MMMTVMDTVSAVKSTTRDRMGRWVTTQHQANTKQKLTIRPLEPISHRDFTANNPTAVLKYVNKKYDELCNHNIHDRLTLLGNLTEPDDDLAERIDRDVVRAAKAAKQRYKSPWSPDLAKAWASIHLYRMLRSQLRNPQPNNWPTIKVWQTNTKVCQM